MYVSFQGTLINLKNVIVVNTHYEPDGLCLSFSFIDDNLLEAMFSFDTVFELDDAYEQILESLADKRDLTVIRKRKNPNETKA